MEISHSQGFAWPPRKTPIPLKCLIFLACGISYTFRDAKYLAGNDEVREPADPEHDP